MQLGAALSRMLPILAVATLVGTTSLTIAVAGDTFGYDFLAYHAAAARVLDRQPLYDLSFQAAGGFGLFYYPPTFVLLVLPFGALAPGVATWAWTVTMLACFAGAVALMPVSVRVRWLVVLLAGLSWPFVYNIKLGQVGPLLLLAFSGAWRGLERPGVVGVAGAIGAAIKLQPGIVLAWALVTGRWRAVAAGVVVMGALAVAATAVAGTEIWADFVSLIARVNDPITTPHNFTPGAIAFQAGLSRDAAAALQVVASAAVAVAFLFAAMRLGAVPSFLVAVIASQLLSPVLWDHYAILLLLPMAWLLERGHAWAALVVLATPMFLVDLVPTATYPAVFWVTLIAVVAVGARGAAQASPAAPAVAAPS